MTTAEQVQIGRLSEQTGSPKECTAMVLQETGVPEEIVAELEAAYDRIMKE